VNARPILAVLLVTAAAWGGGYYLGVEDGRDDLQHRVDELRVENRELSNEHKREPGMRSTGIQHTWLSRETSINDTESL
jgi:hypothetical protein